MIADPTGEHGSPLQLQALLCPASSAAQFVYIVDQGKHVIDRSLGQNPVTEVEDMSGAAACLLQNSVHALADIRQPGKEHGRVQIALHADAPARPLAEPRPSLAQLDVRIEPNDVAAR